MSSGILTTMNTGLSGIRANRKALEVTGANIANMNTEGYTKQRVMFAPNPGGGPGSGYGVCVDDIVRDFNRFTENQMTQTSEHLGTLEEEKKFLGYVEDAFQETEDAGLAFALNSFFNSVSSMASNPANLNERYNVVIQTERLGQEFQRVDKWLRDLAADTNKEASALIDDLNIHLTTLSEINEKIRRYEGTGTPVNELYDERTNTIRKISEMVNTDIIENEHDFQVLIGNTSVVTNNEVSRFEARVDNMGNIRMFIASDRGGVGVDVTDRIVEGRFKGLMDVRDKFIPDYLDQLNHLAYTLVQEVNRVHQQGVGLDGIAGRDFFNAIGSSAEERSMAAANISINPQLADNPIRIASSSDPDEIPYNNEVAVALADMANKTISGLNDQTFISAYGTLLEKIGLDARGVYTDHQIHSDFYTQLEVRRQGESGVSIDEEATKLMIYQKAFEACARVINISAELLELIVNLG